MSTNINRLTEDEAALYDRQLRLWGVEAQRKLRTSSILIVGLRGLGAEIAKNVVLAGVKSLTILDHTNVSEDDRHSNFFVSRADVGHNRAERALKNVQILNPMVWVTADTEDVSTKPDDYFTHYNMVCVTGQSLSTCSRINSICHKNDIKFISGNVYGYYGYTFLDLGRHDFSYEVQKMSKMKSGDPSLNTSTVVKQMEFVTLEAALQYNWAADGSKAKLKNFPDTYFILQVLSKFQDKLSCLPREANRVDDMKELLVLRDEVIEELGIPSIKIPSDFNEFCFSELSPVCAIVGGILAQEIIKAVSHKDKPHNNFFLYNGLNMDAIVDYIGP